MYETIKSVINSKDFKLEEILYKIDEMYIKSRLTAEQKDELENLARENAKVENSYAPAQEQIDNIYKILDQVIADIQELKGTEEPTEPAEEYPEYVAPSGAHDAYKKSDKVSYKGKKYICTMDNCVWSPEVYPSAWEEVKEERESEENGN